MVAVVAESFVDAPCPRVGLTITDLGVGDSVVSVWRTADGERAPVRGARRAVMLDSAFVVDYDAPFGRDISYEVEVISGPNGADRVTTTAFLDVDVAWLMDPLLPQSAVLVSAEKNSTDAPYLRGDAMSQFAYEADVSLINVMGSNVPVALFGQVMQARGIPFSMSTKSADQNMKLRRLMQSTAQLLYRQPPSYGVDLPGVLFVSVASKTEVPVDVAWGGSLTRWEMNADTIAAPVLKVLYSTATWGDVSLMFSTYQQKQDAATGTYLDDIKNPFG